MSAADAALKKSRRRQVAEQSISGLLIALVALCAGALFPFAVRFCSRHNADSLVPVLMSTQHVTLFFWGQARLGSLIPALASWIGNVEWNLIAQIFLRASVASLTPLLALLVLRPRSPFLLGFSLSLIALFLVNRFTSVSMFWSTGHPYGPSLALLAGAVWLLRVGGDQPAKRWLSLGGSFLTIVVATWVNAGLALVSVPLFGLLLFLRRDRENALLLAFSVAGYGIVTRALPSVHRETVEHLNIAWTNFARVPASILSGVEPIPFAVLTGLFAAALVALWLIERPASRPFVQNAVVCVVATAVTVLATSQVSWVMSGPLLLFRYISGSVELFLSVGAIAIAELLWRFLRANRLGVAGSAACFLGAVSAVAATTLPISAQCRLGDAGWFAEADMAAELADQTGARFVAGEFWPTWPAVFAANARLHTNTVFGATFRGEDAWPRLANIAESEARSVVICLGLDAVQCIFQVARTAHHAAVADGPPLRELRTKKGLRITAIRFAWGSDMEVPVNPDALRNAVGAREDDGAFAARSGSPGFLVFGPNIALPRGDLAVTFEFACDGAPSGSFFDVTTGREVLAREELRDADGADCLGQDKSITVVASLPRAQPGLQFRVFYGGRGTLVVKRIRVHQSNVVFDQ